MIVHPIPTQISWTQDNLSSVYHTGSEVRLCYHFVHLVVEALVLASTTQVYHGPRTLKK